MTQRVNTREESHGLALPTRARAIFISREGMRRIRRGLTCGTPSPTFLPRSTRINRIDPISSPPRTQNRGAPRVKNIPGNNREIYVLDNQKYAISTSVARVFH